MTAATPPRRRPAGPWIVSSGVWLWLLGSGDACALVTRVARAQSPEGVAQSVLDAGAPAPDAGAARAVAREMERQADQIRALLAGRLEPEIDPQGLFDVPIGASEERLRLERERIGLLLRMQAGAGDAGLDPPEAAAWTLGSWRARQDLDRARLAFYSLPARERAALLASHRERQQRAVELHHQSAISQAEREARRAAEQQTQALEAARRARTEAARLVNEEYARLLAVTQRQAEYESALIQRRASLDARSEAVLAWRRRVAEITSRPLDAATRSSVDVTYVELRATLRGARDQLSVATSRLSGSPEDVPQAGPDPLSELPAEVDRKVVAEQRSRVATKAAELARAAYELARADARQLMNEVETLNRLRLELLPALSAQKRGSILGFGPAGWDQAASEARQVALTLRYHLRAAFDWAAAIRSGDARGRSAWLVFVLALKWALPVGGFVWWRRHADELLEEQRQRQREKARSRRHGDWLAIDYAERFVRFLQRVRRPLEWVLLVGLVTWLMPEEMKSLLEVRLASTVLLWVFGGLFIVLTVDALASERQPLVQSSSGSALDTAAVRLRSLRLVGTATVAFGLVLSLSDLLVGRGTIHSWVFSTCWFAAIPILFIIVGWWRPFIFERFARAPGPNAFESWVLANRSPPPGLVESTLSSLAAVAGGVYLFARGAVRVVRGRVLAFELTRRLLAYLFRRDLSKKARVEQAPESIALSPEAFRALGPEVTAAGALHGTADAQVREVLQRVQGGAGAIAIVGERGSGKTAVVQRILEACPGYVHLCCAPGGAAAMRAQLHQVLGAASGAERPPASGRPGLLLDDAQHLVRPMMGGLAEFDGVLSLLRQHAERRAWVFAFDHSVWRFVERSRGARPLFDHVVRLCPWREDEIVRLITERNRAAGVTPDFAGLAFDVSGHSDEIEAREAVRRTEANYYRLLWDYASGNPGVALHFWRRSLGVDRSGKVRVRLFDAPDMSHLDALPDSAAFVLRAIIQLGWASPGDICSVTSLSSAQVQDALRYGTQRGYFDIADGAYRVNWDWYRAVTRFLARRHLSHSVA